VVNPGVGRAIGERREAMTVVRSALIQARGRMSMAENVEHQVALVRQAAERGAQITCLQELATGPYFCQVQDPAFYDFAEPVPDGPTIRRMQALARELAMVLIVPVYEVEQAGVYYNTAAVIDADGSYLGKYRKTHIPQVKGFWEKFYFRAGNLGYPVFRTRYATIGVYICYDRHFPEGARCLGLNGAEIVYIPSATSRGLSMHLWKIEQVSHAIANGYWVGTINRVGIEPLGDNDFYGTSYFVNARGEIVAEASDTEEEVLVADLDLEKNREVRNQWQFYRDRRPDQYGEITKS
jgi:beta-ureidopropionase